jgi:glycosyltransferase involved in cell wall biosynthesis
MAYGRPVVTTDVGGLSDLEPDTILVPPHDVQRLHEVVGDLLGSPERRTEIGLAARAHAERLFSPAAAAAALHGAYRRVTSGSR